MSFQHVVKIPRERIGALIGKRGKVKQEIEQKCGVKIEIDSDTGDAVISGNGSLDRMELFRAVEIVTAIARGFSPQRASRLFEQPAEETDAIIYQLMDLREYAGKSPNALDRIRGRIIGQGGKSRRTLEELSGAYISVYGHSVGIIGTLREAKLASEAVSMLAKGSMHKNVYNLLQEARRKEKLDRMRLWEDSYT
ncbi:MAG: KH domain-containing protein [Nitrososphaera sp.]|jgi:ribosomal RNA assembly protein